MTSLTQEGALCSGRMHDISLSRGGSFTRTYILTFSIDDHVYSITYELQCSCCEVPYMIIRKDNINTEITDKSELSTLDLTISDQIPSISITTAYVSGTDNSSRDIIGREMLEDLIGASCYMHSDSGEYHINICVDTNNILTIVYGNYHTGYYSHAVEILCDGIKVRHCEL